MNSASHSHAPEGEQYRFVREACSAEFLSALAAAAVVIGDSATRLRYFRLAIERHGRRDREIQQLLPFKPLRTWYYKAISQSALNAVLPHRPPVVDPRTHVVHALAWMSQHIRSLSSAAGILVVASIGLWIGLHLHPTPPTVSSVQATPMPQEVKPIPAASAPLAPIAEEVAKPALGIAPSTIWLVERGADWELYSNGLRIETSYVVSGEPRMFHTHQFPTGVISPPRSAPAGILFHTTESDVWPLEPDYNTQLRKSTSSLLRYIARLKIYHYIIDRFGRVFRVVADETVANHAGNSIWVQGSSVYLNLNSAFIGVAFETQWEGGRTLPITRAQLEAGRRLTDQLRQRYAIPADMCVTHGLTSVNPKWHLIGHHRDWARGFPFEALGLPNLYAKPLPSVAIFGFGYDREFLEAVGTPWAGLEAAEQEFANTARDRGISVAELRQERYTLYDRWYSQLHGAAPATEPPAEHQ
jgi:hypothetical protein